MKKILCVILATLMCLSITSCGKKTLSVEYQNNADELYDFPDIDYSDCPPITLIRGVHGQTLFNDSTITGKIAYAAKELLEKAEKSDKTVGEIPEGTYDSYNWFEFDEKVYRLYSRKSIALVDGYYGSGTILEIDTEAKEFLYDVISYYPYTTYNGEYSDGKIVFKKVFDNGENPSVKIKNVKVDSDYNVTVTFEAISSKDLDLSLGLSVDSSGGCEIWNSESADVSLKANKAKTFTITSTTNPSKSAGHRFDVYSSTKIDSPIHISFALPVKLLDTAD